MIDAPNDIENGMFRRKVSEDGKYEIGIHPVLFGYRIRSGFVGDQYCFTDYCCIKDTGLLEITYNCLMAIMQTRIANNEPVFDNLPQPEDKYYREPLVLIELIKMASTSDVSGKITLTEKDLQSYRTEFFTSLGM